MLIKNLTAKECQEFVTRVAFGRLGCVRDAQPYVVPIYFAYEPDHLYGFSTVGRKIANMRANPRVCVEVDEITTRTAWTSVILSGRYEELPETPEYASERLHAQRLLEKHFLWWQTAYASEQLRTKTKRALPILYRISIEEMTGRRAKPDAIEAGVFEKSKAPVRRRRT